MSEPDDALLAAIAAAEAARVPGVARLHAGRIQTARSTVTSVVRRARFAGTEDPVDPSPGADPAAVEVDVDAGTVTLTIRVIATTRPPVLEVVHELHRRVGARIEQATGIVPVVIVHVVDVEPAA